MSLKTQLVTDAKNIFTNLNEFSELITYTPYNGTSKTVEAVIQRNRIDSGDYDRNRIVERQAEIWIPFDSTEGVTAVNKGHDKVSFPDYKGGSSSTWRVLDILEHDEGMWHLLVGR